MKYLLLLIVLLSLNCVAQVTKNKKIYIENKTLYNKSSNTFFKKSEFRIFEQNKYIKLKVLIDLEINKKLLENLLKVNILDSNNKNIPFYPYGRGNRALGNKIKKKIKEPKNSHIILIKKKKDFIVIKFPIRFCSKSQVSTTECGYQLKKGKYLINIEYLYGSVLYKSNSVELIIN